MFKIHCSEFHFFLKLQLWHNHMLERCQPTFFFINLEPIIALIGTAIIILF